MFVAIIWSTLLINQEISKNRPYYWYIQAAVVFQVHLLRDPADLLRHRHHQAVCRQPHRLHSHKRRTFILLSTHAHHIHCQALTPFYSRTRLHLNMKLKHIKIFHLSSNSVSLKCQR